MKIIENAVRYRVSTAVGVLLIAIFGGISLTRIPVQLVPTVEMPQVRVVTQWPGALPAEVERQIIQEQEEQLKSLEGLEDIQSLSGEGQGQVNLTFQLGTDIDRALLDVSNRLQQVQRHPETALKPRVQAASTDDRAIAWFSLTYLDPDAEKVPISQQYDFVADVIAPALERVPGVAATNQLAGVRHEMHFYADPVKLATRKLTIAEVAAALSGENVSVSGGDFDEGKINYSVRTVGEYASPEDIEGIVIAYRNGTPILARDVGYARLGFEKKRNVAFVHGSEAVLINVAKAPGANLLEVMAGVKQAVAQLNEQIVHPQGMTLEQLTDQTESVDAALELLTNAVYVGAGLAALILLLFLRSLRSTLIIVVAMPVSVIGTFIVMDLAGRSFNVISLAGIAFAVGMVVDNSIVALENIFRHRQMGKSATQAALDGGQEVWGAILASTLTTVAVFLPVIFIEEEAGQLFRDIAIAISASVTLSMVVAITVIPALASKMLGADALPSSREAGRVAPFAGPISGAVAQLAYWICGSTLRRIALVVGLTGAAVLGSYQLIPQVEYLPGGNLNFMLGNIVLPSNYNRDSVESVFDYIEAELAPLQDCSAEDLDCPGGGVQRYFFLSLITGGLFGASANDPLRVLELVPVLRRAVANMPGAIGGFRQYSLFETGADGGSIQLDIVGPDFERLQDLGGIVLNKLQEEVPAAQARPMGGVDRGKPEVRIRPHRLRAAQLGVSARDLGLTVDALVDGAKVSDYQWQGKRIDLKLIADEGWKHRTQRIGSLPIVARDGRLVTLDSVASVELTSAPVAITHRERQRATTIAVTPPPGQPLQAVMQNISDKVIVPLTEEGILGGAYRIIPRGSADKLAATWEALSFNLLFAVVITYLLMAALFQSFGYPFVILLSVPLAGFGGLLGLYLMNMATYQPLDVLTMLGFFILVGTVVNNAILIVHQALNQIREEGLEARDAIRESVRTRVRPIFMSVLTSVCGMAPLVLIPGAGSELYRGIGSVVIGGLLVSTVFTLVLTPAMLSLFLSAKDVVAAATGRLAARLEPNAGGD